VTERERERETYGTVPYIHGATLSWLIRGRSVDGVRGPATVGFLLSLRVLLPVTSSTAWLRLRWPARERDWMGPSVVRVSADPGIPADLGNDSLPDAVVNTYATTRSDLTSLTASTAVLLPKRSPRHDHRYIHAAPTRPRRTRRLGHTYTSRLAARNRPSPPSRSASPNERRRRTFAPSAAA
jgi:hypothetical protein